MRLGCLMILAGFDVRCSSSLRMHKLPTSPSKRTVLLTRDPAAHEKKDYICPADTL
jgi:hypothetical protein